MPIMPIAQESEAGEPWIQDRSHTDANSESLSNKKKRLSAWQKLQNEEDFI